MTRNTATIIDNIFHNGVDTQSINGLFLNDLSDHFPIFHIACNETIKDKKETKATTTIREFTETNLNNLKKDLSGVTWEEVFKMQNPQEAYNTFFTTLAEYYDKNFPLKQITNKIKKIKSPWITKGIIKSIRTKNKLYKNSFKTA